MYFVFINIFLTPETQAIKSKFKANPLSNIFMQKAKNSRYIDDRVNVLTSLQHHKIFSLQYNFQKQQTGHTCTHFFIAFSESQHLSVLEGYQIMYYVIMYLFFFHSRFFIVFFLCTKQIWVKCLGEFRKQVIWWVGGIIEQTQSSQFLYVCIQYIIVL